MRKTTVLKLLLLLMGGSFLQQLWAQTPNAQISSYIARYQALAVSEMIRTGVPASITLAQGILESGAGQSTLAQKSNNHFGIKCKTEWEGAKTYHDDDLKAECFRVYNSAEDSYRDHSDFLKNRPYYRDLFLLNPRDYQGWAKGLKKAGYATAKDYAQKLIRLIETYQLETYTEIALNRIQNGTGPGVTDRIAISESSEKRTPPTMQNAAIPQRGRSTVPSMRVAQTVVAAPSYPVAAFTINNTKVVFAPKGTSLMALAASHDINFHRLLTLNDLGPAAVLSPGQLIYLEKRPKKGAQEFVLSKYGQTLKQIAAAQGVALKSLVNYNKTAAEIPLAEGQKIYLRTKRQAAPKTLAQ